MTVRQYLDKQGYKWCSQRMGFYIPANDGSVFMFEPFWIPLKKFVNAGISLDDSVKKANRACKSICKPKGE